MFEMIFFVLLFEQEVDRIPLFYHRFLIFLKARDFFSKYGRKSTKNSRNFPFIFLFSRVRGGMSIKNICSHQEFLSQIEFNFRRDLLFVVIENGFLKRLVCLIKLMNWWVRSTAGEIVCDEFTKYSIKVSGSGKRNQHRNF